MASAREAAHRLQARQDFLELGHRQLRDGDRLGVSTHDQQGVDLQVLWALHSGVTETLVLRKVNAGETEGSGSVEC
jgi:hypothetical protein